MHSLNSGNSGISNNVMTRARLFKSSGLLYLSSVEVAVFLRVMRSASETVLFAESIKCLIVNSIRLLDFPANEQDPDNTAIEYIAEK